MSEKKSIKSRRKLLKSIAAGSGAVIAGKSLPESWSRPVVDSVLLPAHAQTSLLTYSVSQVAQIDESSSMFAELMETMVPTAHARPSATIRYCVTQIASAVVNFSAIVDYGKYAELYSATNVPLNTEVSMQGRNPCNVASAKDWLDSAGLVKDASASYPLGTVLITGLTVPLATGIFTVAGSGIQQGFNASPNPCIPYNCNEE